ncbi:MAG: LuxR C-terminal-related transcriptional regulator [Candidatus Binatia bacterium]
MKILVTDRSPVFAHGIEQILSKTYPDVRVGYISNRHELFEQLRKIQWDTLILYIGPSNHSGLDLLRQLKQERPRLPIVALADLPAAESVIRALKAGASGFLDRETEPAELIKAVNKVLRGGRYLPQSVSEILAEELARDAEEPPHKILSDREYDVLTMIASGEKINSIGRRLSLSSKTISTYRGRILQKLALKSNAELIRYALKYKLVKL